MMIKSKIQNSKSKICIYFFICALSFVIYPRISFAQDKPASDLLIIKAWEAHAKRDIEATFKYTQECIDLYRDEAGKEQATLKALPKGKDEINAVEVLNNVATAYFIQAESYMRQDKPEKAKEVFQLIIDKYYYAQAWDQRGWYWQIAEASKQSIKKMETGSIELEQKVQIIRPVTQVSLADPGSEEFVDYNKYGEFQNIGTKDYRYLVKDQAGLIRAVGEGIYPNNTSLRQDPAYKKAKEEGRLGVNKAGEHWEFVHTPDLEAAFFKWATAPEPNGVRLFYTGMILEKSGLIEHALKCYYSIVVHFPGSYGWTYFKTPWYIAPAAISRINYLLRKNPEIGYKLIDADIRIINGFDNNVADDIVVANPGRFIKRDALAEKEPQICPASLEIKQKRGSGKVHLVQYTNGHWQLIVDNQPFVIKGITYSPTKVGQSPDEGTLKDWMFEDYNNNGKIDAPYDAFIDKNYNNLQDADEPAIGDFQLLKEMGVNAIRLYHHPLKVNKELLRDLYNTYGIRVILGDFFGKYALGSGATWNPGTDYSNAEQRKNMLDSLTQMVMAYKDEPYILFWLLGNENVYGYACNADKDPDTFFKFANEAALKIKAIDPDHPVAICSGDVLYLDKFAKHAPDIDIFGTNAYRGNAGFGFLWRQIRDEADRAAFITEFGCPAYVKDKTREEAEALQAEYYSGSWDDITSNMAFSEGAGNALGGVVFEWLDEWWKGYEPFIHDTKGLWIGPFPDGTMHEEWLGLCGQGNGKSSPFLRQVRQVYYMYRKRWQ